MTHVQHAGAPTERGGWGVGNLRLTYGTSDAAPAWRAVALETVGHLMAGAPVGAGAGNTGVFGWGGGGGVVEGGSTDAVCTPKAAF